MNSYRKKKMNGNLHTIATLLLCANIAVGAQDSAREQIIETRFKPTDASGILISSNIEKIYTDKNGTMKPVKTLHDADSVSFSIAKTEIEPLAIIYPLLTAAVTIAGGYRTCKQKGNFPRIFMGLATALCALKCLHDTGVTLAHNHRITHGQHWFKAPGTKDRVMLTKENDTWKAIHISSTTLDFSEQLSKLGIQKVAEAIIANHNSDVKDEDLYTSEIFQKLVSDFKSRC